jgi:hypothetical protein
MGRAQNPQRSDYDLDVIEALIFAAVVRVIERCKVNTALTVSTRSPAARVRSPTRPQ